MNDKARQILRYIIAYKTFRDGNSPSVREIKRYCNISSTSMVNYYLKQLEDLGMIERGKKGQTRSIHVTGGQWVYQEAEA